MSKKLDKEICTVTEYTILDFFRYGVTTPKEVQNRFGISKQSANYWLKKLCKEYWLEKNDRGIYELTESGKKIHDEYEYYKGKQLIRLENMRLGFRIIKLGKIIEKIEWENKYPLRNNVRIYQTHYHGFFIKIVKGKTATLVISCKKRLGENPNTVFLDGAVEVVNFVTDLSSKFMVEVSEYPVLTTKPEFAIPTPIADALLQIMGASQITTDKGKINKSRGRNSDLEPMDIQYAQKIVDMPNTIDGIFDSMLRIQVQFERLTKLSSPATSWFSF